MIADATARSGRSASATAASSAATRRSSRSRRAPRSTPTEDRELRDAAVRLCRAAGYRSAGTVEFLFDPATQQFMFMEVNTRLQVEHPVTELTTGLDLVKLQLHIARRRAAAREPAAAARPRHRGPAQRRGPGARLRAGAGPGRAALRLPSGPGIRVDTGVAEGDEIAAEFDSMIAKIIAWGTDRDEALGRLHRALAQTHGGHRRRDDQQGLPARPARAGRRCATGTYDNRLARPADGGRRLSARRTHPVALLAAAIEAYDADQAAVQANFLRRRGPRPPRAARTRGRAPDASCACGGNATRCMSTAWAATTTASPPALAWST